MSKTRRDSLRVKMSRELDRWLENGGPHHALRPDVDAHYRTWTQRYPHWWDTLYHHAPTRRNNRDKLRKVMKGEAEDDGNWGDHKKPHKYYW